MIRNILFAAFFLLSSVGFAQWEIENYTHNNFSWEHYSVGSLAMIEAPADSGIVAIFRHSLFVAGLGPDDQVKSAAQLYCQDSCYFAQGPLKVGNVDDYSSEVEQQYDRMWRVTREQIELHQQYFECVSDINCDTDLEFPNGYTIPEVLMSWPAMGDVEEGYAEYLAPFVDFNSDGAYNAEHGDYPDFCGDFAIFQIYNDVHGNSTSPIGIEVHSTLYGFENQGEALHNTLFVKHKVFNRSTEDLTDAYAGIWTDFDIGGQSDDYIGTDVQRSMIYGYNGDEIDGPEDQDLYGTDIPAIGVRILGGPLADADGLDNLKISDSFETYGNQTIGWDDGLIDNERLGLSTSLYFNLGGNPINGHPESAQEFYNYMRGRWLTGQQMTYGSAGYDENNVDASYFFPGNSDPLLVGTNGIDPEYENGEFWSEESEGNPPSGRSMLGSSGPFTLPAGGMQEIDYAFVFARKSYDPELSEIETMQQYSDEIVEFACVDNSITNSVEDLEQAQLDVLVYPNPATDQLIVQYDSPEKGEYELFDLTGRSILSGDVADGSRTIELSNLSNGTYILRVKAGERLSTQKVIVQR